MPKDAMDRLMDAQDDAQKAAGSDVAQLAMLSTVRGMTDVLGHISDQLSEQHKTLGLIGETMHSFDKRLLIMENDTLVRRVESLEKDMTDAKAKLLVLEFAEHGRKVERGLAQAIFRSPTLAWLVAAVAGISALAVKYGVAVTAHP